MEDHNVLLGRTVVERFKDLLPRRLEVLNGGLTVELAGQDVEEVRVEEGEAGEPVLLGQGVVVHELPHYHVHHGGAEVAVVHGGPPHGLQVVEDDPSVEALSRTGQSSLVIGMKYSVGLQLFEVIGREIQT